MQPSCPSAPHGSSQKSCIAGHAGLGVGQIFLAAISSFSALVDFAAGVEMEDRAVGILVIGDGALAGLPRGGRAKEHAVPIHIEKALAIVVPDRCQRAG